MGDLDFKKDMKVEERVFGRRKETSRRRKGDKRRQ
jgi:hypothetical protein